MNLTELQREAHAIAVDKGWWDEPPKCVECDLTGIWDEGRSASFDRPEEPAMWFCGDGCGNPIPSPLIGPIEERTFGDLVELVNSALTEVLEADREYGVVGWFGWPGITVLPADTLRRLEFEDRESVLRGAGLVPKPEGLPDKLAGVVVRVADIAEHYGIELQGFLLTAGFTPWSRRESLGEWLGEARWMLSQAFETFYADTNYNSGWRAVCQRLADIILWADRMAVHHGIDLDAAIDAKIAYMRVGR